MSHWIRERIYKHKSEQILKALVMHNLAPAKIESAQVENVHITNAVSSRDTENVMNDQSSTGFSTSGPELSRLIALAEWVERLAMREGHKNDPFRFRFGSDGCAAQPVFFNRTAQAKQVARMRARAEAMERFLWSTWADNPRYGHFSQNFSPSAPLLEQIQKRTALHEVVEIIPKVVGAGELELHILLAFLSSGGVLTAGAAGPACERDRIRFRALAELLRHSLAVHRFRAKPLPPADLYEERLLFLASNRGEEFVRARLERNGAESVVLPPLQYDSHLTHPLENIVAVYHCLHEGHPGFIDGPVERMCL